MRSLCLFFVFLVSVPFTALANQELKLALIHTFSKPDPMCYDQRLNNLYNAVIMAWKDFKQKNPNIKFDVSLIKYDYDGNKMRAADIMKDVDRDGVIAAIGYVCSDYALLGGRAAQQLKIPLITPTATDDEIENIGDYVYMSCFKNGYQGDALARFAFKDLGKRKALVITAADCSYCLSLSQTFKENFARLGGEIVGELSILTSDSDFTELVTKAKNFNFDTVFVPNYAMQSAGIISAFLKNNLNQVFLGGDGWNWTDKMFDLVGSDDFVGYMTMSWIPEMQGKSSQDFVNRYQKMFNEQPLDIAAHSYDSAMIILNSLKTASALTREALAKAMSNLKTYSGITGNLVYNGKRSPRKSIVIVKLADNKQQFVKIVNP